MVGVRVSWDIQEDQVTIITFNFPRVQCYVVVQSLSCVQLFVTLWTVACQAPLSMGFSRQEDWTWLPFPSPRDLADPRIEPGSPVFSADSIPVELQGEPCSMLYQDIKNTWGI